MARDAEGGGVPGKRVRLPTPMGDGKGEPFITAATNSF